jgi:hypothetical protein
MIMKISLDDVKNILESEFFHTKWDKKFHFVPAELWDWAEMSGLQVSFCDIENWEDFEYGRIIFDDDTFRNLVFEKEYALTTEVLLISDESLKAKAALGFIIGEFNEFADFYFEMFEEEIFQPLDIIVYIRRYNEIRIIHHEGKLIKIRCDVE